MLSNSIGRLLSSIPVKHKVNEDTLMIHSALHAMQILNDQEARFNSADMNIAYKMGVDEYQRLCPYASELEANWGKAPGKCLLPSSVCCSLSCS